MADSPNKSVAQTIYLEDYRAPGFQLLNVELRFELHETATRVYSKLKIKRHEASFKEPFILDGQKLELIEIKMEGQVLSSDEYIVGPNNLTLKNSPAQFLLEIETVIDPASNSSLMGLYLSSGNFCTQCEAEGFRKITYFPDRPDVLTTYTVTMVADKEKFPVLLSNGNLIEQGDSGDGQHFATWHDPWPKPSYLFALVAGNLEFLQDKFVTTGGHQVDLFVYAQPHNIDRCDHAMACIKSAMRWDEQVYHREYDLDRFMIVAVDDFNMGAMENKGLNIFNSKYVLAKPETATDTDFQLIEGIIGHEYFHNWSGNRVTCRDWFQLSLKEGFTVFRDQEFSADMSSRGVKRAEEVNVLRAHQFREDAGPMAHPVRPQSYQEINNFYTVTVYNKGAEVVRMLHTLVGHEKFIHGTDLYFQRHDGQAVTTDDFVQAISDAAAIDLTQFGRWYDQAGTPKVKVTRQYDVTDKTYTLNFTQSCPPTPGQDKKRPFHIPVRIALKDQQGDSVPLSVAGDDHVCEERVVELTSESQSITFQNIPLEPVPSLLRDFSAPVKLDVDLSDEELAFLLAHDDDAFNRWDAGQRLATKQLLKYVAQIQQQENPLLQLDESFADAFKTLLQADLDDMTFQAFTLTLPSESMIAQSMDVIDPTAIHQARQHLRHQLAAYCRESLQACYLELTPDASYQFANADVGRRKLRNQCLAYLLCLDNEEVWQIAEQQFHDADNMTDQLAALITLANSNSSVCETALESFRSLWRDDPLVMDKWLTIQATSSLPNRLTKVKALVEDVVFSIKNPNKVRSLIGAFCHGNSAQFHAKNGEGYEFLVEKVLTLDTLNPQGAAHLVSALIHWKRYDDKRQQLMRNALEEINEANNLSADVAEIVSKSIM